MSEEKSAGVKPKREIRMCDIDPKFKYEMSGVPGFEKLRLCFQCGTCTADCPIARFSEIYHPRRLMRMTQLGMKDRVLGSEAIWLCAGCFTCVDHCPQGVDLAGVLRALRNIAAREGVVPPVFKELQSNISSTGYAYKIPELRVRKRVDKGLPSLPNTDVEAVAKLFKVLAKSKEESK